MAGDPGGNHRTAPLLEIGRITRSHGLRAEAIDDPDELWVHDLIGSEVVTVGGDAVGTCVAVVANPASDLLELDSGALVPVVFVVERAPGRVTIDPPEGLLEP